MEDNWIIAGKIVAGVKQGTFFTQLEWFQEQCADKLGFKPYPGTLNLEISGEYFPIIESLDQEEGIELISPDPKFCNAKAFSVSLGEISGAIIIPDEKVRVHAKNIIEIVAPLKIKSSLQVRDGDLISVAINRSGSSR